MKKLVVGTIAAMLGAALAGFIHASLLEGPVEGR
jgi:hypothetical protein